MLFGAALLGAGVWMHAAGITPWRWSPETVRAYVLSFGPLAPVVYLLAYGQPLVPLPASVMMAAAGLAFGPVWGVAAALAGSTIRACSQFLMVRLLGRKAAAQLITGRLVKLHERLGARPFTTTLMIRLVPNVPFDMQNYAFGLSRIRFLPYALGSCLGITPASFAYVYFGYSLTDPRQMWKLVLALLLVLALAWLPRRFSRRRRQRAAR